MDAVDEGVVGIITNHSYLDNPTFRGMRQSLTQTFNQIYILDLHGSTKPRELTPPNTENANVFDIQKGVAIAIFVKSQDAPRTISYSEFWGTRLQKYQKAADTQFGKIHWQEVGHFFPYYMFRPLNWAGWDKYKLGQAIADSLNAAGAKEQIFALNVLGFQSHRDHFAISFDRSDIEARAKDMIGATLSDKDLGEKYKITGNRDWNVKSARESLRSMRNWRSKVIQCAYRPFDSRYCFFGTEFMDYPIMLPEGKIFVSLCPDKSGLQIGDTFLWQVRLRKVA